jgi:dTDP-4-dehydrorhamnose 3,5-epimerase
LVPTDRTFRELAVPGAWEITPQVHGDDRGRFFEWFTERGFTEMAGHRFSLSQANCSISSGGVLRGLHFAQLPPSQAKYVTCLRGSAFDVVVDVRVGSPTYGLWDSVLLDDVSRRSIYLSEGLAHGFLALQDQTTVMYLCSTPYAPQREHTIAATDPEIGIDWPLPPDRLTRSGRDAVAPPLADIRAAGLLPTWEDSQAFIAALPRD